MKMMHMIRNEDMAEYSEKGEYRAYPNHKGEKTTTMTYLDIFPQ